MDKARSYTIGHDQPVFFIAEAGVNHNGDARLAHDLIDVAVAAGADAVKFQTFSAETLVSPSARKAAYQEETTGGGSQFEMLKGLELPESAWRELDQHCHDAGIIFMSSPFDQASVDLLVELGVDAIKLGSGELTNRPLIEHCALTGLPIIMSTGMANRKEVNAAVSWFRLAFQHGEIISADSRVSFSDGGRLALLHCVSSYPAPEDSLNLRAIASLRDLMNVPIGFSDHSTGNEAVPLAVAAGACIIEKHYTLDRSMLGPDHRASLEPQELTALVQSVRQTEVMLGNGVKQPHPLEEDVRQVARKSVVALRDLAAGEMLSEENIAVRRPATGLEPARFRMALGARVNRDVPAGEPLQAEWLEGLRAPHAKQSPQRPKR